MSRRLRHATDILAGLDEGALLPALSDALTETLRKLNEHNAGRKKAKSKGAVSLKIEIVVEDGMATIVPTLETKTPKETRSSAVFWVLQDGTLSTEHPRQTDMFAGPRVTAGTATGA